MIREVIKYARRYILETKEQNIEISIDILKSALVFQYLHLKHFNILLSINEVIEIAGDDIGLIGPGKGLLTWMLEKLFSDSPTIKTHAILHDSFGRFYHHYSKDRGYMYSSKEHKTSNWMKKSPFCGQISGLIYCKFNNIIL